MNSKIIRVIQLIKVMVAFVVSFVIANAIAFFYNHDPQWIFREGGPTKGIYAPGRFVLRTDEGFGYEHVDANGYVNRDADIGSDYVLVFGKSHTNAVEVMPGERYVDVLDKLLYEECGKRAYCVSRGGSTFADLLSGFGALVEEFPNSGAIVIEMSFLDSKKDYESSLNQRKWNNEMRADYLMEHLSFKQKISGFIKEYTPLVAYFVNYQLPAVKVFDKDAFMQGSVSSEASVSHHYEGKELEESLNAALQLIRSKYDGKIIVLYHPDVRIDFDGSMKVCVMEDYEVLERCCDRNDILLCNTGDVFIEKYDEDYTVPYGFWNTSMGEGHLNKQGHEMIAELLFESFFMGGN